MSTRVNYLYRDADNYKQYNTAVLKGEPAAGMAEEIMRCLHHGEWFIPRQVGLPEERFPDSPTEADHCWFEWNGLDADTEEPTIDLTIEQLIENFRASRQAWDDVRYAI